MHTMFCRLRSVLQTAEVSEPTPRTLYLTAAILIREGFITLEDLYPHVSTSKFLFPYQSSTLLSSLRPMTTWKSSIESTSQMSNPE